MRSEGCARRVSTQPCGAVVCSVGAGIDHGVVLAEHVREALEGGGGVLRVSARLSGKASPRSSCCFPLAAEWAGVVGASDCVLLFADVSSRCRGSTERYHRGEGSCRDDVTLRSCDVEVCSRLVAMVVSRRQSRALRCVQSGGPPAAPLRSDRDIRPTELGNRCRLLRPSAGT
jgi:hypothetical protein